MRSYITRTHHVMYDIFYKTLKTKTKNYNKNFIVVIVLHVCRYVFFFLLRTKIQKFVCTCLRNNVYYDNKVVLYSCNTTFRHSGVLAVLVYCNKL